MCHQPGEHRILEGGLLSLGRERKDDAESSNLFATMAPTIQHFLENIDVDRLVTCIDVKAFPIREPQHLNELKKVGVLRRPLTGAHLKYGLLKV